MTYPVNSNSVPPTQQSNDAGTKDAKDTMTEAQVSPIEGLSAITLATRNMRESVGFYRALGFEIKHGGEDEAFTTFACGPSYLNLIAETHGHVNWWGRLIIYVADVDAMYRKACDAGLLPSRIPSDAPWGERYFHISDPDGHELSFAKVLQTTHSPHTEATSA